MDDIPIDKPSFKPNLLNTGSHFGAPVFTVRNLR